MPESNCPFDLVNYRTIAATIGLSITGINLLGGYYTKYSLEKAKDYSSVDILTTSVKKGVILGGLWPVTGCLTFSYLLSNLLRIGLQPSNQIFSPIDMLQVYHGNDVFYPTKYSYIKDDNEISEESENVNNEEEKETTSNDVSQETETETETEGVIVNNEEPESI